MPQLNNSHSYSFKLSGSICYSWNQNSESSTLYARIFSCSLPCLLLDSLKFLFFLLLSLVELSCATSLCSLYILLISQFSIILIFPLLRRTDIFSPLARPRKALRLFPSPNIDLKASVNGQANLAGGLFFELFIPPLLYTGEIYRPFRG